MQNNSSFKEKVLQSVRQRLDFLVYLKDKAIVQSQWLEAYRLELLLDELETMYVVFSNMMEE